MTLYFRQGPVCLYWVRDINETSDHFPLKLDRGSAVAQW